MTLKAMEATLIADAVRRHNGNRSAAARELGINPSTLFRKVKATGIELPPPGRAQQARHLAHPARVGIHNNRFLQLSRQAPDGLTSVKLFD